MVPMVFTKSLIPTAGAEGTGRRDFCDWLRTEEGLWAYLVIFLEGGTG